MRFLTRSLAGLLLFALTLGLIAVGLATLKSAIDVRLAPAGPGRPAAERSFSARVVVLQPGRIAPTLTAYGEIASRRTLELRAAAAGQIVELAEGFADGARVRAGDVLVRIDPADAQSALDLARAGLSDAEVELRDATRSLELARADLAVTREQVALRQTAYDRQKGIGTRGFGTATDLETAELALSAANQALVARRQAVAQGEARLDKARTAIDRQKLALDDAERRLAETVLRAEFDGVLSGVTAVAGGLVAKTEKLGELVDADDLEVSFRLSTAKFSTLVDEAGRLMPLPVTAALDIYGAEMTATGKLARVDATVGTGLSGRLVFATLGDPRGLKPGDFVTVSVSAPPLDGVALLPAAAIGSDGTLLVLGEGDRLEAVPAEVLRQQRNEVIVRVGTLAGREVVTERTPLLGTGILIRPIRDGKQSGETGMTKTEAAMIDLTPERRAELIALVEGNGQMPRDAKERILVQLREGRVPAAMVLRIEARMGG
jgi:multidrug efflux pump subunit AcrA (membrane-fusion protein)